MTFGEAVKEMKENGLAVMRVSWEERMRFLGIKDGKIYLFKPRYPRMPEHGYRQVFYGPTQEDILAEDWSLCTDKDSIKPMEAIKS